MGCSSSSNSHKADSYIEKEIRKIPNDQYTCTECYLVPEIKKIDHDNGNIEFKCRIHGEKKVYIKDYFEKEKIYYYCVCKNDNTEQKSNINYIFNYCTVCNKIFCQLCFSQHEHQSSSIKINELDTKCHIHKKDYNKYCNHCKKHFCVDCGNCKHNKEDIKGPNTRDTEKIKDITKKYEYLIKFLKTILNAYEEHPTNYYNNINIANIINKDKSNILSKKLVVLEHKIINYFNTKFNLKLDMDKKDINLRGVNFGNSEFNLLSGLEFKNLEELYLANNKITNIEPIKSFKLLKLKIIDLSSNQISDILPLKEMLDNNKEIRTIKLNNNKIDNIDIFKNNKYSKLKSVSLENNIIKDFKEINGLIDKNYECTLKYKLNNNDQTIRFFGEVFIKNNMHNLELQINGKKHELKNYYDYNEINNGRDTIEIKLKINKYVTDLKCFFKECSSLISIEGFSEWNTCDITNFSNFFQGCSSLTSLPDISKWDTSEVTDMSEMFKGCSSLESLPDISNWNTENVTQMQSMFEGCTKLKNLPDLSLWNFSRVINMNHMFDVMPDTRNWFIPNNIQRL